MRRLNPSENVFNEENVGGTVHSGRLLYQSETQGAAIRTLRASRRIPKEF